MCLVLPSADPEEGETRMDIETANQKARSTGTEQHKLFSQQITKIATRITIAIVTLIVIYGIWKLLTKPSGSGTSFDLTTALFVGALLILIGSFAPNKPWEWLRNVLVGSGVIIIFIALFNSGLGTYVRKSIESINERAEYYAVHDYPQVTARPTTVSVGVIGIYTLQPGEVAPVAIHTYEGFKIVRSLRQGPRMPTILSMDPDGNWRDGCHRPRWSVSFRNDATQPVTILVERQPNSYVEKQLSAMEAICE